MHDSQKGTSKRRSRFRGKRETGTGARWSLRYWRTFSWSCPAESSANVIGCAHASKGGLGGVTQQEQIVWQENRTRDRTLGSTDTEEQLRRLSALSGKTSEGRGEVGAQKPKEERVSRSKWPTQGHQQCRLIKKKCKTWCFCSHTEKKIKAGEANFNNPFCLTLSSQNIMISKCN